MSEDNVVPLRRYCPRCGIELKVGETRLCSVCEAKDRNQAS